MCNRLGQRKLNAIWGKPVDRTYPIYYTPFKERDYWWHLTQAQLGFNYCGENLIERKPSSAKHKLSAKLKRYDDMALSCIYSVSTRTGRIHSSKE